MAIWYTKLYLVLIKKVYLESLFKTWILFVKITALFFSLNGEDMRLMLWDTAGQEEFDCITRAYYRGAQACVLAFSCVDRESFKSVGKWKRKVEEECGNIPMVLVMTKMDLLYRAEIDSFEVEKLSRNLGIKLVKTSVKENINVQKVNNKIM